MNHARVAALLREGAAVALELAHELEGDTVPAGELAAPPANDATPKRRRTARAAYRPTGPVDDVTMRRTSDELRRRGLVPGGGSGG